MKKKLLLSTFAAVILSSSITVCAAPQYMADGAVFDPEWYLEQNPDVATGWSLGTSADALYAHYTMHGAGESRKPYNEATLDMASILPYQNPATTQQPTDPQTPPAETQTPPTETQTPSADPREVWAVEGAAYQFQTIRGEDQDYADCIGSVYYSGNDVVSTDELPDELQPYSLPGYTWKRISLRFESEGGITHSLTTLGPVWFCRMIGVAWTDSVSNYNTIKTQLTNWITYRSNFTLNMNNQNYTECKIFEEEGGINESIYCTWYALLPEGYNTNDLWITYSGCKLEAGELVDNEASPIIKITF